VTLVEPRKLRAAFLEATVGNLSLTDRVRVTNSKVEKITGRFDVITARAVARLDHLLATAIHLAHDGTVWTLPKGKSANSELAEAMRSWQCDARSEASATDPEARILVLAKVRSRSEGGVKSRR
jgi:16S rRNA (guanine527-N7)-methyltransferase